MTIGIIGLGYVGLTLAIAAADAGVEVYGVEVNPHIKQCLAENRAHFFEPGLDALIRRHNNKSFHVVEKFPEETFFDAFIITVGTPLLDDHVTPNFDYIRSSLESIREVYNGDSLIILRSTVSVGTTRNVVRPMLKELCGREEDEILVAMCPERTVEGKAVYELSHLPQIISGNNERSLEIAQNLFRRLTPYVIAVGSLEEAELVKLYCNTYRDMSFAIGNAFCLAAQRFGVDGSSVIRHANQGYDRASIALPGFVAGPCLEKDAYILTSNMPDCASRDFILASRHLNESLEDVVVDWVARKVGAPAEDKPVMLSGMAFKGVPETSDLRGSSSVYIARKLRARGYTLRLHDFVASQAELAALGLGEVVEDLDAACADAAALCVLNNHRRYAALSLPTVLERSELPVLDTWGACAELAASGKQPYQTFGDMNMEEEQK